MSLAKSAEAYAIAGIPIFPCSPGTKYPLTEHGFKQATCELGQVTAWWRARPDENIAAACLLWNILDVDDNGEETLLEYDPLPICPEARTPRGGKHLYFAPHDSELMGRVGFRPGLDFRAISKNYVLLPPSTTSDGVYSWVKGRGLKTVELPPLPAWIVELCKPDKSEGAKPGKELPKGSRNDALFRWACLLRRNGATQDEIMFAMLSMNEKRGKPPLPERDIRTIAASAAKYEPDPGIASTFEVPSEVRSGLIGDFKTT